jgi:uncharacterized protein (DUF305 family)
VQDLAIAIQVGQQGGVETMGSFLADHGQAVPESPVTTEGDTTEDIRMNLLRITSGPDFDRLWVQMMTGHHLRTVALTRFILAQGENEELRGMADRVRTVHESELEDLRAALAGLGA